MLKIADLDTHALVIYKHKAQRNAQRMLDSAKKHNVALRPHFKTTKCVEAAIMQTGGTRRCMVVSTIPEVELLKANGFDDILFGVPMSKDKLEKCASFAEEMDKFLIFTDGEHVIELLKSRPLANGKKWLVLMKLDCDNGRAGVLYNTPEAITLAKALHESEGIEFYGVYAHCGDTYYCKDVGEVQTASKQTAERILEYVQLLKNNGIPCKVYGTGSTPSCSNPTPEMGKLTEWHPGNYIIYDEMQRAIGSCAEEDIAGFVVTRVIGHYKKPAKHYMIVDCGFTGLSLHGGGNCYNKKEDKNCGYGAIVGHPEIKLAKMSQEHGIIEASSAKIPLDFNRYPIGTMLRIFPDHSCATCAMHPKYFIANENEEIIETWIPARGW